ncbi:hypothetical protein ISN45_Aa08g007270 [Arabidopsis thaliana x Arabidopsis arenosa]|uniref:Transmembrane protein n=1 Tax=Arabidopsis thaliana x Arabidopsis arenosa TaxID=1240361 RepID=A0A8T1XMU1_9BRAS|nr:hypothetical protein ISN45_Aa08g007270 [Arabidopsis thaliana x Arabidopsis arenosa]
MKKKNQPNLRLVFFLLVVILVSSSIDRALASPQELLPLTGWRVKMIQSQRSRSNRSGGYGRRYGPGHGYYIPKPPPPPLLSPLSSPLQSSSSSLTPSSMPFSSP